MKGNIKQITTEDVQSIVSEAQGKYMKSALRDFALFGSLALGAYFLGGAQLAFYICLEMLILLVVGAVLTGVLHKDENES